MRKLLMFVVVVMVVMMQVVMFEIAFSFIRIRIGLRNAQYAVNTVSVVLTGGDMSDD